MKKLHRALIGLVLAAASVLTAQTSTPTNPPTGPRPDGLVRPELVGVDPVQVRLDPPWLDPCGPEIHLPLCLADGDHSGRKVTSSYVVELAPRRAAPAAIPLQAGVDGGDNRSSRQPGRCSAHDVGAAHVRVHEVDRMVAKISG